MAKGRGRPNKYFTHVQPRLDDIKKMCLTMTEKQMAETLGVSYSCWCDYKNKYSELSESIKKGRESLVVELKSTLIKKAKGFQYSEKKITKLDGKIVQEVEYIRSSLPDVAALNLLLKNLDKDNWSNDPQMIRLREKELELKERQIDENNW